MGYRLDREAGERMSMKENGSKVRLGRDQCWIGRHERGRE